MIMNDTDKNRLRNFVIGISVTTNAPAYPNYATSEIKKLIDLLVGVNTLTAADVRTTLTNLPATEKTEYEQLIFMIKEITPGVDEEVLQNRISLRGFGARASAPTVATKSACTQVQDVARNCIRYLGLVREHIEDIARANSGRGGQRAATVTADKTKAAEFYKKWFDAKLDNSRFNKVNRIFTNVLDAVAKQKFEIVCDADLTNRTGVCACASTWFGAAIPSESLYRFYICAESFPSSPATYDLDPNDTGVGCKTIQLTQVDNIVATIIHELTHLKMIGSTKDEEPNPYDVATMQDWAKTKAHLACNNADTYAYFAIEVINRVRNG